MHINKMGHMALIYKVSLCVLLNIHRIQETQLSPRDCASAANYMGHQENELSS